MTQQQPSNHIPEAKKMVPGDELHLTLLMAPCSLHLVTGQDRQHLLAFGRAAFETGQAAAQQAVQAVVPAVRGEVLVTVSGFTGSGKSAIAGEIEIMCRALGLQVEWPDGVTEKNMTHADWTTALELYNPRVRIIERNVPRNTASGADQ